MACLLIGNFLFTYVNLAAVVHRERWHLAVWALLTPFYWALMSLATWRALYQLVFQPHVWEKTHHGLSGADTDPAALAAGEVDPHQRKTAGRSTHDVAPLDEQPLESAAASPH